ncbi:MAG: diacylglycerol/polyprenol kinase family protein [Methanomassiliicoccales archaeon]
MGGDALGLILVYAYVGVMVVITDRSRFLRDHSFHRKFIHVMIGNIALFWWVFDTNYVMSLLAAVPFIPLLFIFSKYGGKREKDDSKLVGDLKGSILSTASHDGHKLGLVYYAISWALLAFLAFNDLVIASVGIVCMAYGDGMGGLVGKTFGKRKIHGNKTLEGTIAVFVFAALAIFLIINYYNLLFSLDLYGTRSIPITISVLTALGLSAYVAVVELYTPGEYDNLVIPLSTALIMFLSGI